MRSPRIVVAQENIMKPIWYNTFRIHKISDRFQHSLKENDIDTTAQSKPVLWNFNKYLHMYLEVIFFGFSSHKDIECFVNILKNQGRIKEQRVWQGLYKDNPCSRGAGFIEEDND